MFAQKCFAVRCNVFTFFYDSLLLRKVVIENSKGGRLFIRVCQSNKLVASIFCAKVKIILMSACFAGKICSGSWR